MITEDKDGCPQVILSVTNSGMINHHLREWFEKQETVYAYSDDENHMWCQSNDANLLRRYSARVIAVRPLKKESSFEEIGREFVRLAKDENSGIDDLIELRNKAKGVNND